MHTPRRCGHDVNAALLLRYVLGSRPFLINCWTVGMFVLSSFVSLISIVVTLREIRVANVHLYFILARPLVDYFLNLLKLLHNTLIFNEIKMSRKSFFFNISTVFLMFNDFLIVNLSTIIFSKPQFLFFEPKCFLILHFPHFCNPWMQEERISPNFL